LKRFLVTFDYRHRRLYLKPPPQSVSDTGTFDRSGMWLNSVDDGFEVGDVTPNSSAAAAGLKVGDRIIAVDGVIAGELKLSDLRVTPA
jgi:C-terminal processing protease CtpA/Prc